MYHGPYQETKMNILSIDIGGTHVKVLLSGLVEKRKFDSGPTLTAQQMVDGVMKITTDWEYDHVSMGLPTPIQNNKLVHDPVNLGSGWVDFDFDKAFGKPTRMLNDAAMQALGSYEGGKMLFLGLGTGLGTTIIDGDTIIPLELAHLPYRKKTFEDYVGIHGLEKYGKKKWREYVFDIVDMLDAAVIPDYIVLGGGNAERLKKLPDKCRLGHNANAFIGGFRMWDRNWKGPTPK